MIWLNSLYYGLRRPVSMSLAGMLALSFVVWYEGPPLALNGRAPLESPANRWTLIAVLFAIWVIYWGARWAKTRLASSNFVRSLVADASAASNSESSESSEARKATDGD